MTAAETVSSNKEEITPATGDRIYHLQDSVRQRTKNLTRWVVENIPDSSSKREAISLIERAAGKLNLGLAEMLVNGEGE